MYKTVHTLDSQRNKECLNCGSQHSYPFRQTKQKLERDQRNLELEKLMRELLNKKD